MPDLSIPTPDGSHLIRAEAGIPLVFVGANGSGKTRLGAYFEGVRRGNNRDVRRDYKVHRVGAQRRLVMAPVNIINRDEATRALYQGASSGADDLKSFYRWNQEPVVGQLDDFERVLQVLFADHLREAVGFKRRHKENQLAKQTETLLERAVQIWHALFPQRELQPVENSFKVLPRYGSREKPYEATQLSDGERGAFYLIGQTLTAPPGAVLIVDEPELHVHQAVLPALWDKLEAVRNDLAFVYLTHDLGFAASRRGAKRVALLDYHWDGNSEADGEWTLRELSNGHDDVDEELATRVLGSRRPVLFVEGAVGSLDAAVWRRAHPDWSVTPIGSCEAVIHATVSFNANGGLHRMRCVGVLDGDGREEAEKTRLADMPVHVLPVAEIENLFLLPAVYRALAHALGLRGTELDQVVHRLASAVVKRAELEREEAVARRVARLLDRRLKGLDLATNDIGCLQERIASVLSGLDVQCLAVSVRTELDAAIADRDIPRILELYDNKGLLADAAQCLNLKRDVLEKRILGLLADGDEPAFVEAVRRHLPSIVQEENAASPR